MKTYSLQKARVHGSRARAVSQSRTFTAKSLQSPANRQIRQILSLGTPQTRVAIAPTDDPAEHEADRIAKRALGTAETPGDRAETSDKAEPVRGSSVTRRKAATHGHRSELTPTPHPKAPRLAKLAPPPMPALRGSANPLPETERAFFEPLLNTELTDVRVHTCPQAAEMASAIGARAFTMGHDIAFAEGKYAPASRAGRELLAHELAHVAQAPDRNGLRLHRWSGSDHMHMTELIVTQAFPATPTFRLNSLAAADLATQATAMDFKTQELEFNVRGWLIGKGLVQGEGIDARLRALQRHYDAHPYSALCHGEGGHYRDTPEDSMAANQRMQDDTIGKARQLAQEFVDRRTDADDPQGQTEASELARDELFRVIGDAFHIAQDRGAHGEGAVGAGHARQLSDPNWDPDNRAVNAEGWEAAKRHTRQVVDALRDVLGRLLNTPYLLRRLQRDIREVSRIPHLLKKNLRSLGSHPP